ncbi:MAG: hypothetical protein CVV57_09050 [Tenericutes bacterium HGW-Tenericutes-2]|jgi:hypothetical protein|nr:MAG: hypothetical protein CVV57_09050 [Tenericutes bacterium HGW-Tenericutes-2]
MIIILSPAKTFSKTKTTSNQVPYFQSEALSLVKSLKKKGISEIMDSMKISENLAHDVKNYYLHFEEHQLSAIHTYDGQAFKGFDIHTISSDLLLKSNEHLYILSGLYGLLKPLDQISYYRLDIKDQIVKNLYSFWKKRIEKYFNEFHHDELIINLASSEYSRLLPKNINIVTIDFLQIQNGKYKSISMFVKKMRGMMARYLIEHSITELNDMKKIELDGYRYNPEKSSNTVLIFSKEV